MGGVRFHTSPSMVHPPLLWRQPFDARVQCSLITSDQPNGTLSISEMALIAHKDVLAQQHPVAERTLWMATDNRAALSWISGTNNVMADDASWLWHLSDEDLLTHFNLHYPQASRW